MGLHDKARLQRWMSVYNDDAFSRVNEEDDKAFYIGERLVQHLDERALQSVERIIETLVVEKKPRVLDLMASIDSHIPESIEDAYVVGLGLNQMELHANERLGERLVHDLNRDPRLPFADSSFDIVLITVSINYVTKPMELFTEVARVLVPGGLFLVVFSNRMFKDKTTRIWAQSSDAGRQMIVEDYFASVTDFGERKTFVSMGHPRPKDDKFAGLGLPSDPVWAVWAEKNGAAVERPARQEVSPEPMDGPSAEELARRKAKVGETLQCPYCEEHLSKWELPPSPFNEWPNDYMYICFNNDCPYLISGWQVMNTQGNPGFSYRLMYDPTQNRCMPVPLPSRRAEKKLVVVPRG
ncbi:MAG: hypothetical protein A2289_13265 [Deltaproteobacteria bacterium RIFOXYA12_FULL_58_15]|nr:MAG: hypothetical protein A2289_13265 [Deltaproteobacteria bacterium RIFOXYA12_FULL_58_15]OGR13854.1 MAG: hypothetical protein A2341_01375 [Deltaproteobacteria bacterium RIFOXYB12_FULL_58_9]